MSFLFKGPSATESSVEENHAPTAGYDTGLQKELAIVDEVLARKLALVNGAIDEIGMTPFQWKLFFLSGFGYAVDSLLVVCQSIAQPAVTQEFGNPSKHIAGVALALQVGLLVGAAVWGFSADVIGRKLAFNSSLFICAAFVLIAGGMLNHVSFCAMFVIAIPFSIYHGLIAVWWAVGYTITGLLAGVFMSNYSCDRDVTVAECTRAANMGWRNLHITCGGLVLVASILRLVLIRMVETPKWLVSQNRDDELIEILSDLSKKYNRPFNLAFEELSSQGRVQSTETVFSALRLTSHFTGLFRTKRLTYSTVMVIINWLLIGTVSPLSSVFLPYYLQSRSADTGDSSKYTTWRNYAINQAAGLIRPVIAAVLIELRLIGRRRTLAVGAAITTAL